MIIIMMIITATRPDLVVVNKKKTLLTLPFRKKANLARELTKLWNIKPMGIPQLYFERSLQSSMDWYKGFEDLEI